MAGYISQCCAVYWRKKEENVVKDKHIHAEFILD